MRPAPDACTTCPGRRGDDRVRTRRTEPTAVACLRLAPDIDEDGGVDTDPIPHTYTVGCGVEEAFSVYTRRIHEWWHPAYTANPERSRRS